MIDVGQLRYDLVALLPDGSSFSVAPALEGAVREEQPSEFAQHLSVRLYGETEVIGRGSLRSVLPLGVKLVELSSTDGGASWTETFRGSVKVWDQDDDNGLLTLEAWDELQNFLSSDEPAFFPAGLKGADILQQMFASWGVPVGRIEGPTCTLPKLVWRTETYAQRVLAILQHAVAVGDKSYLVRMEQGLVNVVLPGENTPVWLFQDASFGNGANVLSARLRRSILDAKTEILVIGAETETETPTRPAILATVVADDQDQIGRIRTTISSQDYDTADKAIAAAKTKLAQVSQPVEERPLVVPDAPLLRRGDLVRQRTAIADDWYVVNGVGHDSDTQQMTLQLLTRGAPLYQPQEIQTPQVSATRGVTGSVATLLDYCRAHLGTPYVWGGKSTRGWDCSGFTKLAFESIGIEIGDGTGGQSSNPNNVRVSSPAPGDLVFFPGHVGIVAEDTSQMYNALDPADGTKVSSIAAVARSLGGGPSYRRPKGLG